MGSVRDGLRHLQECMVRVGQIVACEVILTAVFSRTGVADEDTDHGAGAGIMLNIRDTIQTRVQEHSKHAHGHRAGQLNPSKWPLRIRSPMGEGALRGLGPSPLRVAERRGLVVNGAVREVGLTAELGGGLGGPVRAVESI